MDWQGGLEPPCLQPQRTALSVMAVLARHVEPSPVPRPRLLVLALCASSAPAMVGETPEAGWGPKAAEGSALSRDHSGSPVVGLASEEGAQMRLEHCHPPAWRGQSGRGVVGQLSTWNVENEN